MATAGPLAFDEETSRQVEALGRTRDVQRRRRLVLEAIGARSGERVLDVGCGPGFYVAELLERVGPGGSAVGVDTSPQMLAIAERRCARHDNVSFRDADAVALPLGDGEVDIALSVQVMEYVAEPDVALGELYRVLRPGGRVVVWDVDWATVSWHSSDPALTDRVLTAWDEHLAHPSLPRTLAPRLRAAGFVDVGFEGHPFVTAELSGETYGGAIMPLIAAFVVGRQGLTGEEVEAWAADLRDLDGRGEYYFACTQFCFTGTKADS
jgi:SAM-dependent methyltransferase